MSLTEKAKNVTVDVAQVPGNVVAVAVDEVENILDLLKKVFDQTLDTAKSVGDAGETRFDSLADEFKAHAQNATGLLGELVNFTKRPGGGASA